MADWNPNSTPTKGLEATPYQQQSTSIDSAAAAMIAAVPSLASESIGAVRLYIPTVVLPGKYELEITADGDEVIGAVTTSTAVPNEDVTRTNMETQSGGTTNLYQTIDEAVGGALDSNYITGEFGTTKLYEGRLAVGSGNYTGRRILKVALRWWIKNTGTSSKSDAGSGLVIDGTNYDETTGSASQTGTFAVNAGRQYHWIEWTVNPATGEPWTIADIERFDTSDEFRMNIVSGYNGTLFAIEQVWLEVQHCAENRVARGALDVAAAGWNTWAVHTPTRGTWAKANATTYSYILRRLSTSGAIAWRAIQSLSDVPTGHYVYSGTVLDAYGAVQAVGTAEPEWMTPIIPRTAGYLETTGGAGGSASTPDSVPLSLTGDIDVRVCVALDDYTTGAIQTLVAHWGADGQEGWRFAVNATGSLVFSWTTNGSTEVDKTSTVTLASIGLFDTGFIWLRVQHDVSNGGNNLVDFAYSFDPVDTDPLLVNWTALGATVTTAGTVTRHNSTATVTVGATADDAERADGKFFYAEIRSSITAATIVADPEFDAQTAGAGSFSDGTQTWTINSPAVLRGAGDTADSQPYALLADALVYTGQDAEQEFSDAAADDYGVLQFLVWHDGTPTGDLVVTVKRRSDNVQMGGAFTLTPTEYAELAEVGNGWKRVTGSLASAATLAAATQYYIEFSSTTTSDVPWVVQLLDTESQGNAYTFGGTTDRAVANGAESDDYDLEVTLSTVPDAPTGFAVETETQSLPDDGTCCVAGIEYAALSWNQTILGADFWYYEVQRSEDGGTTWATIALMVTEVDATFDDYEGLRNVMATYRVRVIRLDGAASGWTTTGVATPTTTGNEWVFVANEMPSLNCAYNTGPIINYRFLHSADVVYRKMYGRPYQVQFQPLEDRGVEFDLPLTVDANDPPTLPGVVVFDRIRALAENDALSYICVLDPDGNRWLAGLLVAEGTADKYLSIYKTIATVTQVGSEFSTPQE